MKKKSPRAPFSSFFFEFFSSVFFFFFFSKTPPPPSFPLFPLFFFFFLSRWGRRTRNIYSIQMEKELVCILFSFLWGGDIRISLILFLSPPPLPPPFLPSFPLFRTQPSLPKGSLCLPPSLLLSFFSPPSPHSSPLFLSHKSFFPSSLPSSLLSFLLFTPPSPSLLRKVWWFETEREGERKDRGIDEGIQ